MPPRGVKTAKKPAPKRVIRKAAKDAAAEEEAEKNQLPELEDFLTEQFDWPTVTDILAEGAFKEAAEEFTKVAEFRQQLKDSLAPCYTKRKIPRTPRKLAHKPPIFSVPQATRILDFDTEPSLIDEHDLANNTIVINPPVPETSTHELTKGSNLDISHKTQLNAPTHSPVNDFIPTNAVICATPNTAARPASIRSASSFENPSVIRSTPLRLDATQTSRPPKSTPRPLKSPRQPNAGNQMEIDELKHRLEEAEKRKQEHLRDQQERIARDLEQRKRRVNQNLMAIQQEEDRKKEEHRLHHEHLRLFEEAQRTPKTPKKTPQPPTKIQTPGQKAVPPKRQKQDESAKIPKQDKIAKPQKPKPIKNTTKPVAQASKLPVPKPRRIVEEVPVQQPVETPVDTNNDTIVVEEVSVHQEDHSALQMVVDDGAPDADKENRQQVPPHTPLVSQAIPPNESVYELTPDKVFQPSTDNDYNVNDLSSGDETDNEENPRKRVPRWAEKANLRANVLKLFSMVSKDSINEHFGVLKPPKIGVLFANNNKNYSSFANETTTWDSPIGNPRSAPLAATHRNLKK